MNSSGHLFLYDGKRGQVWYAKLRLPDGSQTKVRIGKRSDFTETQANRELRKLIVLADEGEVQRRSGTTFKTIANEWLDYIEHDRNRKHSTVVNYRNLVQHDLLPRWNGAAADVTSADVDAYRMELVSQGLAATTVNKRINVIASIYKRAAKTHGLRANPTEEVERQPHTGSGNVDALDPTEVMSVARAAPDWYGTLILVAAFTGLRMGELRDLRWGDVSFENKLIYVRHNYVLGKRETPKSHKVRSVPLINQAYVPLLRHCEGMRSEDSDLVFPNEVGRQFDDSKARKIFKVACKSAKVREVRFHDLRHTFGTLAVQVFPLSDVQKYMGHSDIKTTMIYVHHKARTEDAQKLSDYISAQLRGKLRDINDDQEAA